VSDSPQCPPDRCVACWYHQPRQGGHGPDLRDLLRQAYEAGASSERWDADWQLRHQPFDEWYASTVADAAVAQGSEQVTHNDPGAGSSPARRTDLHPVDYFHAGWCAAYGRSVDPAPPDEPGGEYITDQFEVWADAEG
jgi:hypothetical protein